MSCAATYNLHCTGKLWNTSCTFHCPFQNSHLPSPDLAERVPGPLGAVHPCLAVCPCSQTVLAYSLKTQCIIRRLNDYEKTIEGNIFKHRTSGGILGQIADKEDFLHRQKNIYISPKMQPVSSNPHCQAIRRIIVSIRFCLEQSNEVSHILNNLVTNLLRGPRCAGGRTIRASYDHRTGQIWKSTRPPRGRNQSTKWRHQGTEAAASDNNCRGREAKVLHLNQGLPKTPYRGLHTPERFFNFAVNT